jgi:uncharacterized protein Usg
MVSQDFRRQLEGYGLTTANIMYRRPDHPWLLQSYVWQNFDLFPKFPELNKFLNFWIKKLDGPLHSVTVAHARLIKPAELNAVDDEFRLHWQLASLTDCESSSAKFSIFRPIKGRPLLSEPPGIQTEELQPFKQEMEVNGIADTVCKIIAAPAALGLEMTDHWFDGGAPPQLHSSGPFGRGKFLGIGDVLACDIRRPNQWSGVSPFKGRLMDEIPDAEYKVVEHQIAPALDPSFAKVQCRAHVAPNWTYVVGRSAALKTR